MIRSPYSNRWNYRTGNVYQTRPAASYGTAITPGNNTYGTYASILAGGSIVNDCFFVVVNVNDVGATTTQRNTLVKLGIDRSGGTTYADWIPHLFTSDAQPYAGTAGGCSGHWYYFPLFVPAGAQIAAVASQDSASPTTARVAIWLFGKPSAPELMRYGTYVDSFGEVTATSEGTVITCGTTSEGSWTALGSAESREHWWWQCAMGSSDTTMAGSVSYAVDVGVGDGSNKHIVLEDQMYSPLSSELMGTAPSMLGVPGACVYPSNGSSTVYGRIQCSGTADDDITMIAYGVGG